MAGRQTRVDSAAVPEYAWDVQLPGEDLPRRVTTDYLVSDGEAISVDGREWLIEHVEIIEPVGDDDAGEPTGIVSVVAGSRSLDEADDGIRTRDTWLGKPVLYQLSYVRAGAEF